MPDVIDYAFRAGYWKHGLYCRSLSRSRSRPAGGDIRRQDMPFVSNRMNLTRVDALAEYYFTLPKNLGRARRRELHGQRPQRRPVDDAPDRRHLHLPVLGEVH